MKRYREVLIIAASLLAAGSAFAQSARPAGTEYPARPVQRLNSVLSQAIVVPDVKQRHDQLGLIVTGGTAEDFGRFTKNEAGRLSMPVKTGRAGMTD